MLHYHKRYQQSEVDRSIMENTEYPFLLDNLFLLSNCIFVVHTSDELELKFPKQSRAKLKGFRTESSQAGTF